ncbi:MAG: thioesterase family protein [Candidatus Fermentibacter sp.]|nr:thioesterase family protein [Candidatus Fermentibacter sp.]
MGTDRFGITIGVQPDDIDVMGHVNNTVYLRWVQEAATAHWEALAAPGDIERILWVVVRHEIDYLRPAMPGDTVRASTWVGPLEGRYFTRFTEIARASDGRVLAKARTLWCPIDAATLRPTRATDSVMERFTVPSSEE